VKGGYMKITIKTRKDMDAKGHRLVSIGLDVEGMTNRIFTKGDGDFELRRVQDGVLMGEEEDFYPFVNVRIADEKEIQEIIDEIVNLYKSVLDKNWKIGEEKEYCIQL
jgi:hypothetical protein